MDSLRLYFDHNAGSPLCPEARDAMQAALTAASERWGNPSSPHRFGHEARVALEEARSEVAALIGAESRDVVFVSGGTEADNLAIHGAAKAWLTTHGLPGHLVTTAVEHPAVLAPCRSLADQGWRLTELPVDHDGVVEPDAAGKSLTSDTALLSVMLANNETGTLQPVADLATRAREAGVLVHTDAVQAVGRTPVNVERLGVDYLSFSAHKIGGPVGIGALWIRDDAPFEPLLTGGSQERRRRPGTESVLLATGFAAAARAARLRAGASTTMALRDRMERELQTRFEWICFNGAGSPRVGNTSSQTWPGVDNETLVIRLDLAGIAISTGSACSTGASRPSHVLTAMGRGADEIGSTIRVSLGPETTDWQIDVLIEKFAMVASDLRRADPVAASQTRR